MLVEMGRIAAIDDQGLWIETFTKSGCGSCAENAKCGTGLLERYFAGGSRYLLVRLDAGDRLSYQVGDEVQLGLDEQVLLRGSFLVYLVPLGGLLLGAMLGFYAAGEMASILAGLGGMITGGVLVRWHAWRNRFNRNYNPVILDQSSILARSPGN